MLEQLPKILEESRKQVERALNSPLKLKAQVSEVVYPNAKYGALFSSVVREDSALGEQCGSVADFAKGTTDKVANLSQNLQSSHSPTANLRILEADNRGESEKVPSPSLRGVAQAFHTNKTEKVDSSMDCHADKSARNDRKAVDSVIAPPPLSA